MTSPIPPPLSTVSAPDAPQAMAARPQRVLLAILFMILASTLFPIMNGMVQVMSDRFSTPQLVWARALAHTIFIFALFMPKFGWRVGYTHAPKLQLARSICLMTSTFCFFSGVKYLPLAKAASISFMAPFIVALLSWPMLRERVTPSRFVAVIVGFVGVLIVVQPGGELFNWASLYILASATCYALYQILTRKVASVDSPETSAVYAALVATVVMSGVVPFYWTTPTVLSDWGLMFGLGVIGGLGHYCVARAMTYAPANIVSPFQYWQLVGSVVIGYLITREMPEPTTWLGAAVLISAGLFIGYQQTREKRAAS